MILRTISNESSSAWNSGLKISSKDSDFYENYSHWTRTFDACVASEWSVFCHCFIRGLTFSSV